MLVGFLLSIGRHSRPRDILRAPGPGERGHVQRHCGGSMLARARCFLLGVTCFLYCCTLRVLRYANVANGGTGAVAEQGHDEDNTGHHGRY